MTLTSPPPSGTETVTEHGQRRSGRWIDDWRPEDEKFWTETGAPIAKRNLIWSIFAEHLGFSVWLIWSVSSAFLLASGFEFTPQQLFFLVAIPNLVGSLLRVPYTLAVGKFGGRNWTMISAALLLVPTLGFAYAVTNPSTPYWAFCVIAATAGFGGGNFASSMANINFFYPSRLKGSALGLNAAGGNIGVALIQFFLPVIVGGAGIFGLVKASASGINLERAAWVYAGLAIVATVAAYFKMDNLGTAKTDTKRAAQRAEEEADLGDVVPLHRHLRLVHRLLRRDAAADQDQLLAAAGAGRRSASASTSRSTRSSARVVGSLSRPLGGYLADRVRGCEGHPDRLRRHARRHARRALDAEPAHPLPPPPDAEALEAIKADPAAFQFPDAVQTAVDANADVVPAVPRASSCWSSPSTGIGNGSTYKMIPAIFAHRRRAGRRPPGTPERDAALRQQRPRRPSAALGIIGAVGALGGFLIPIAFSSPWVDDPLAATKTAFVVFTGFYLVCALVTFSVCLRAVGTTSASLAEAAERRPMDLKP